MEKESWLRKYGLITLLFCVIAVGAYLLYIGYTQVPLSATVTRIGETVTKKHGNSYRSSYRSYTAYHTTLTVVYEENGEERRDDIAYAYRTRWTAPNIGDQIQITANLMGRKVQYPDSVPTRIGWIMLFVGGVFLLAIWVAYRAGIPKNPYWTNQDAGAEEQGMPQLETTNAVRQPDGSYQWRCQVDDDTDRRAYKVLLYTFGGICIFLMLLPLIAGMDGEMILIMLGCCAFMMLLAIGIGRKMLRGPERTRMRYKLYENDIRIGSGRSVKYISFRNVREVKAEGNKIFISTKYTRTAIFIPPEDFETIKGYILQRIGAEKCRSDFPDGKCSGE